MSVVMPAYNQERTIVENVKSACRDFDALGLDFELIVVDDGSPDATFARAKSVRDPRVRVVGYAANRGKGHAITYGCRFVRKPVVAFIDSGMDLPTTQLKLFLDYLEAFDADIVIGSKRHPLSKSYYPPVRRFLSGCFSAVIRVLFNLAVTDTQVGFKVLRREVVERVMPLISVKRFAFDVELLVVAQKFGYRVVEAPVLINYGRIPSTVSVNAMFTMFVEALAIFYRKHVRNYYDR